MRGLIVSAAFLLFAPAAYAQVPTPGVGVPSFMGRHGPITLQSSDLPPIPASKLPAPTSSTRGGALDGAAPTNNYQIGTSSGVPLFARPTAGNISFIHTAPGAIATDVYQKAIATLDFKADYGGKGDGSTDDSSNLNFAITNLNSIVNGGRLHLSCGVYVIATPTIVTFNAYTQVTVQGDGSCSELFFKGLTGTNPGLKFVYNQEFDALHMRDFAITTDTASDSTVGIGVIGAAGTLAAADVPETEFTNIIVRSHSGEFGSGYFGKAFYLYLAGNVTFNNLYYWGAGGTPYHGVVASSEGSATGCTQTIAGVTTNFCYNAGLHFNGGYITQCAYCVYYGNYLQNVSFDNTDMQGCAICIYVPIGQTANAVLNVNGGSFYATVAAIANYSASDMHVGGGAQCEMVVVNSTCIIAGAPFFTISGLHVDGANTGTSTPVSGSTAVLVTNAAHGGVIGVNEYSFIAYGNLITSTGAGAATNIKVQSNSYDLVTIPNTPSATTGTITIGGGSP